MKINLIVFRLSNKTFAFQLEKIPLVISFEKIKFQFQNTDEIPSTITYLLEEINIFNLHKIFKLNRTPIQKTSKLLVGEHGNITVGCLVDKVVSVMKADESDIIHNKETKKLKYARGVLPENDSIILLDIDKIYKSEVVLQSIKN